MRPRTVRARVVPVRTPAGLRTARRLFREYARAIGVDLEFEQFSREVRTLPGVYAPPGGRLFLARWGSRTAGCVAVRPLAPGVAELKRLFVRPTYRGRGVGRRLVERVVAEARRRGYRRLRLDTLEGMRPAIRLYLARGFRPIPPYHPPRLPGTKFFELRLRRPPARRRRARPAAGAWKN